MRGHIHLNMGWKNGTIEGIDDGQLENDIKLMSETFARTVVEKAAPLIEDFAAIEMQGYYDEYDPIERYESATPEMQAMMFPPYERDNLMLDDSYKIFTVTSGKNYQGGIELDPSFTFHDHGIYRGNMPGISEAQIYRSVWNLGLHGRTSDGYIEGMPERLENVRKKASNISFLDSLKRTGMVAVSKQKYSVLKFT